MTTDIDMIRHSIQRILLHDVSPPARQSFGSSLLREIIDTTRVEAEVWRLLREQAPALAVRVDLRVSYAGGSFHIDITETDAVTALGRVAFVDL